MSTKAGRPRPVRFPYHPTGGQVPEGALPFLPRVLQNGIKTIPVHGLVDSGASVNVLPYRVGLQLGADWETLGQNLTLGGNLAAAPAKGLVLSATVDTFAPVRLVFAWSRLDTTPVILGQMNFFQLFAVRFIGAEQQFEVQPYQPS
ncbi:MAG: hypothetical protein R3E79_24035 [Caldilineaceae bacterium]